jgi:hypothetical protein
MKAVETAFFQKTKQNLGVLSLDNMKDKYCDFYPSSIAK